MEQRATIFATLHLCAALLASGCATMSEERTHVIAMATERLDCPANWQGPHIEEGDEAPVRHWSASCNHRSVRITCTNQGCSAEVQRPRLLCDSPLEMSSQRAASPAPAATPDPATSH